jgi:hypothetical protein
MNWYKLTRAMTDLKPPDPEAVVQATTGRAALNLFLTVEMLPGR